jgi:hypothetical protein
VYAIFLITTVLWSREIYICMMVFARLDAFLIIGSNGYLHYKYGRLHFTARGFNKNQAM